MINAWLEGQNIAPAYNEELCLRQRFRLSQCNQCATSCPAAAISVENGVRIAEDRCKGCQICVGSCPAGALSARAKGGKLSAKDGRVKLVCRQIEIDGYCSCLGQLTAVFLAYLGVEYQGVDVIFSTDSCKACHINISNVLQQRMQAANEFLEKCNRPPIVLKEIVKSGEERRLTRRSLFSWLSGQVAEAVETMVLLPESDRDYREQLVNSLAKVELEDDSISAAPLFYGLAAIPECSFCGLCAKVCKTKALTLSYTAPYILLLHDQSQCTGCGACRMICPQALLTVSEEFSSLCFVKRREVICLDRKAAQLCPTCGNVMLEGGARPCTCHRPEARLQSIY